MADLLNIDRISVNINCPRCDFYNKVTFKQVRIRGVIICRGCKSNIQLVDHMNTVRKSVSSIRRSLSKLEKTLAKFGKWN